MKHCKCGGEKAAECHQCKAALCRWHHALTPRLVGGLVDLRPVCFPGCHFAYDVPEVRLTVMG